MTLRSGEFTPEKHDGWRVLSADPRAQAQAAEVSGAPAGALPEWLSWDHTYARTPTALLEFEAHLARFVEENRLTTRAARIVINLHGTSRPLPFDYVKAIERTFRHGGSDSPVQEVVIYTSLIH